MPPVFATVPALVRVPPPDWVMLPLLTKLYVAPLALLITAAFSRNRVLLPASLIVPLFVRVPAALRTKLALVVSIVNVPLLANPPAPRFI